MNLAYQATEEDVENVLRSNSLTVANTMGKTFEAIANEVFGNLDFDRIEQAALFGDDMEEQCDYANDEIARQLREMGILEPLALVSTKSKNVRTVSTKSLVILIGNSNKAMRGPIKLSGSAKDRRTTVRQLRGKGEIVLRFGKEQAQEIDDLMPFASLADLQELELNMSF